MTNHQHGKVSEACTCPSGDGSLRWPCPAHSAPQQEAQEPTEISEAIERMAADRYKVVPSHESMFHRWAVVAGTGTQQLYLGREIECQNMARKFAGAFLDGAFVAMQQAAPRPAPTPLSEPMLLLRQILEASQDGDSDTHLSAHFVSRIETITKLGGEA